MKNTFCLVFFLLVLVSSATAQFVSPVPVAEIEVRDNTSVKMRSIELDRVKREGKRVKTEKLGRASLNNFLIIKEDFEKIQKLQNAVVALYTKEKQINYAKIAVLSAQMNESAVRLNKNLFPLQDKDPKLPPADVSTSEKREVKTLIVELDKAIGDFVGNPIFLSSKKAGLKEKEKAAADLVRVIRLAAALKQAAEKK